MGSGLGGLEFRVGWGLFCCFEDTAISSGFEFKAFGGGGGVQED